MLTQAKGNSLSCKGRLVMELRHLCSPWVKRLQINCMSIKIVKGLFIENLQVYKIVANNKLFKENGYCTHMN